MRLAAILESGRRDFLDSLREISPEQARERPSPDRWSVLECVEHVVAFEDRHLRFITQGTEVSARPDHDREIRLFTAIRSRLTKLETPAVLRPAGRFTTLEEALAAFQSVRDRSVQLVEDRGESLYAVSAEHPHFGKVNGAELIQLIDGHTRRHAEQILETGEALIEVRNAPRKPALRFVFSDKDS